MRASSSSSRSSRAEEVPFSRPRSISRLLASMMRSEDFSMASAMCSSAASLRERVAVASVRAATLASSAMSPTATWGSSPKVSWVRRTEASVEAVSFVVFSLIRVCSSSAVAAGS